MRSIPIVPHLKPDPPAILVRRVETLAAQILSAHPEFELPEDLRRFSAAAEPQGPCLVFDDLSEILLLDTDDDSSSYQDRARLRAGDGDIVVTCGEPEPGYEDYCRTMLGLGEPDWLHAKPLPNPLRIAEAIYEDRGVRRDVVHQIRDHGLRTIHPHMGTRAAWELAALLSDAAHVDLQVLAPPPAVTQWANNKVEFTSVVRELFGPALVPRSSSAWNYATAAAAVRRIADGREVIALKAPDAAAGGGNVVISTADLCGQDLAQIEQILRERMEPLAWGGRGPLLITAWETNVLCSPSAQMWIPPDREQMPVLEGLYIQSVEGETGAFVGSRPAELPHAIMAEMADRCWLVARLFQLLGYVGRCSFDLILLGASMSDGRIEFIECNGRWGGTSIPMTLMNRLFGDWKRQPYSAQVCTIEGLDSISFQELLAGLADEVYDTRRRTGRFVLYNPARMAAESGIAVIGLAEDWATATVVARTEFQAAARAVVQAIRPA